METLGVPQIVLPKLVRMIANISNNNVTEKRLSLDPFASLNICVNFRGLNY